MNKALHDGKIPMQCFVVLLIVSKGVINSSSVVRNDSNNLSV